LALALLASGHGIAVQRSLSRRAEDENLAANLAQARMGALLVADQQGRLQERLQADFAWRNALSRRCTGRSARARAFSPATASRQEEVAAGFLTSRDDACILSIPALFTGELSIK